eukprot:TRINITY_DN7337_c0_g1_i7.p1 TRINITY_DN7337_c0_g1~~TRINITY_DN7337_c0_g1_i7.p1  ORF type:complete len:325 (-),score=40.68 TRINITY_DN7337_c0_g1_i7:248-1222(-)
MQFSPLMTGIILVMTTCILNGIFLELLVIRDPKAGGALTLVQFCSVSLVLLPEFIDVRGYYGFKPRVIPLWYYMILTVVFFLVSYLNNIAFGYHISQPIHVMIRSSSLIVSFFLGICIGNRGTFLEFLSVVMVTAGTVVALNAEVSMKNSWDKGATCSGPSCAGPSIPNPGMGPEEFDFFTWVVGLVILFVALVLSALLGHLQSYGYKRWGKASSESMFYSHFLALAFFNFSDSFKHFESWDQLVWLWVVLNCLTQYLCVKGVYLLFTYTSALSATLILTLRKFLSLLVSVLYFKSSFGSSHWLGACLVFCGCLLYSFAGSKRG